MKYLVSVTQVYTYEIDAESEDEAIEMAREKSFEDIPDDIEFSIKQDGRRKVTVAAYPYATQYGEIFIPNDLQTKEETARYVEENFDEIQFDKPNLDYRGTDFTVYDGDNAWRVEE